MDEIMAIDHTYTETAVSLLLLLALFSRNSRRGTRDVIIALRRISRECTMFERVKLVEPGGSLTK